MESLVADTLKTWREAERVLRDVPPQAPEHERVRVLVIELRAMYASLSSTPGLSPDQIAARREQIAAAQAELARLRSDAA